MASLTADQAFAELKEYVERGGNAGKKSMNDMLPVTESRNAKWWYSAFHNVTAIVGVGVLGFPAAMAHLTWGPGIAVIVLSWIITLYTFWQLVEMHEMIPGKRFDRYHELGQEAFGERRGLWIVVPLQLGVQVSTDIVYMVSGGLSLQNVHRLACYGKSRKPHDFGIAPFILVFASPHFILAQLRNFNSIKGVSLAAAVMSLSYTTIAWGSSIKHGRKATPEANYKLHGSVETSAFEVLNAIGVVAFAYSAHSVALEIQASIPSTATKPSKDAMWKGVLLAYAVVAFCYLSVGISGYWAFGYEAQSQDNILTLLEHPRPLMIVANMMVFIHVLGGYQVFAMPVYDMLEIVQVKYFKLAPTFYRRMVARSAYVAFTAFVACLLPFFNALMAFLGGFALAPTTYFMPCVIWLRLKKPKRFSLSWIINWILIILGVLLMLGSAIGGMWSLHKEFGKFSIFHLKDPAEAPSPAPHPPVAR